MGLLKEPVYTVHTGTNPGLIKNVSGLYFNEGDRIADVTWGKGVFWKEVELDKYEVVGSDIKTGIDFRNLHYEDNSFDHGVIDPPYARKSLPNMIECYNTSSYTTHDDILDMYRDGLKELKRVVIPGGYILCKCMDEVYGTKQKWTHIEITEIAEKMGLYAKDLFVLVNTRLQRPKYTQQHARKNHSYLWVFQVN